MKAVSLFTVMTLGVVAFVIIAMAVAPHAEERSNDRIGIIGAMEVEVNTLIEATDVEEVREICGTSYYSGTMNGRNVVIAQCGMGKVNAGICAQMMITEFNVKYVINSGTAGALDDRLEIGDIVISTDAVQHDFDVSPLNPSEYDKGEIPYTGKYSFEADSGLIELAVRAAAECAPEVNMMQGRICTGDQFINSDEQKNAITSQFGGLCCEMEGGAIAQVCYLNDTPFVIIRAMADKADGTLPPDYSEFEKMAAQRSASIVQYMVFQFPE